MADMRDMADDSDDDEEEKIGSRGLGVGLWWRFSPVFELVIVI